MTDADLAKRVDTPPSERATVPTVEELLDEAGRASDPPNESHPSDQEWDLAERLHAALTRISELIADDLAARDRNTNANRQLHAAHTVIADLKRERDKYRAALEQIVALPSGDCSFTMLSIARNALRAQDEEPKT